MKTTKFLSSLILFLMLWGGVMGQARDGFQLNGLGCAACQDSANIGGPKFKVNCKLINYNDGVTPSSPTNSLAKAGYTLIMRDEFNTNDVLDTISSLKDNWSRKWTVADGSDWYNWDTINALTGDTVHFNSSHIFDWSRNQLIKHPSNGTVELTLSKQNASPQSWLTTELFSKMKFRYGYAEARIKTAEACGIQEGFWLWGAGNGDINAFEFWYNVDTSFSVNDRTIRLNEISRRFMFSQYWCPSPPCSDKVPIGDPHRMITEQFRDWVIPMDQDGTTTNAYNLDMSKDFFIYAIDWDPTDIRLYINNTLINTFPNKLTKGTNVAFTLGGYDYKDLDQNGMGIDHPMATPSPTKFIVDYIRVYKKNSTFNTILDHFPSKFCLKDTASLSFQTLAYEDFIPTSTPNTTYVLSVISQPAGNTAPLQFVPFWNTSQSGSAANGPDWGNIAYNVTIPPNALPGDYVIKLELKPRANGASDTTTIRAYKTLKLYNSIPPNPTLSSTVIGCKCKVTLTTPSADAHTWTANSSTLSPASFTYYQANGETTTFGITASNTCGTRSRVLSRTCNISNCPVRMMQPNDENETVSTDSLSPYTPTPVIYPNPLTGNTFRISLTEEMGTQGTVEIRTQTGILVHRQSLTTAESDITVPDLRKGTYLCTIFAQNQRTYPFLLVVNL